MSLLATQKTWLCWIFVALSLLATVNAINQKCTPTDGLETTILIDQNDNQCPANSKCNPQGYCVCDRGYFGNCQLSGQYIDGTSKQFTISQQNSYFLIEPIINEFVNFQFVLCNENSLDNSEFLNLWVDDGNLITPTSINALGNDKEIRVEQGCIALITSYFSFGMQPNGEKQTLILGLRLRNPGTTKVQIIVQQISIFGFDVIIKIIMILVAGIVLISMGGLIYCMYKCRRRRSNRFQEERLDISFFDEYMPVQKANLKQLKEELCSVCLGEFKQNEEIRPTVCNHYFHKTCLDEWCVTNLSCPICRTSFEKANLIHEQYLMSRGSSTRENDSVALGAINREQDLREPIV